MGSTGEVEVVLVSGRIGSKYCGPGHQYYLGEVVHEDVFAHRVQGGNNDLQSSDVTDSVLNSHG